MLDGQQAGDGEVTLSWTIGAGCTGPETFFTDPALNGTGGQDYVVPAGVCDVSIVADGAAGGNGDAGGDDPPTGGLEARPRPRSR